MVLAVVATYFAASRPARAITKVPIVTALSGRPAPPKQVHRSVVPGVIVLVVAFFLLSGCRRQPRRWPGGPRSSSVSSASSWPSSCSPPCAWPCWPDSVSGAPVAVRLAVRDLARYRSRSGSALAAISLGVLIAVIICRARGRAVRQRPRLRRAQPGVEPAHRLHPERPLRRRSRQRWRTGGADRAPPQSHGQECARASPPALGPTTSSSSTPPSATLQHAGGGRQFTGTVYVATPQLLGRLRDQGLHRRPRRRHPHHAAGSVVALRHAARLRHLPATATGGGPGAPPAPRRRSWPHPTIEQVSALPSGTSAPNTVITEHAVHSWVSSPSARRLADPDGPPSVRGADQRRPADGGQRRE